MSGTKVSGSTGKFTADCSDPRQAFGGILAAWLRTTFGRGARRKIQAALGIPPEEAEAALAGHVSVETLMVMIAVWREPFIASVINPMMKNKRRHRDLAARMSELEMRISSIRDQLAVLNEEVSRVGLFEVGEMDNKIHDQKNRIIRKLYEISQVIPGLKYDNEHHIRVSSQDDMKIFSGKVLEHHEISIDQISDSHADMLRIYNQCDGYLTDSFVDQLIASKFGHAASIYDEEIKVKRIGTGTVFWTEQQRRALVGRSIWELPAPQDYVHLTYSSLMKTVKERKPILYLVGFKAGSIEAYYDRIAFPFPKSGLVVGSPRPRKVISVC